MKQFSCGDVVPGCVRQFSAPDEVTLLSQVAAHARADHGLESVPPELVQEVRASLVTV